MMRYFVLLLFPLLLCTACKDSDTQKASGPNYLDTTFVDGSYRETLDAISQDKSMPSEDREAIRAFIRKYRKRIPEGWTYGKILEAAKGMRAMREQALGLTVLNFQRRDDLRLVEIYMELKFKNLLEQPIEAVYGDIYIQDSLGRRLHASPPFVVPGPLAPGAETGLLRLQYAYDRPTGNEMNDPRKAALRDTLDMVKDFARQYDSSRVRFRVRDILLEGGVSNEDYWLMDEASRKEKATGASAKATGLLEWAKQNETLIKQFSEMDGVYYLSVRPVLTDGYEAVHGPHLLFDRRLKVVKFFTQQKKVPGGNIDPMGGGGALDSRHKVDFWDWPVELWIYKRAR